MTLNKNVLALGADVKNKFLFAKGEELYSGPAIGDLADVRNFDRFKKGINERIKKFGRPRIVACDFHPAFFSTAFARDNRNLFARDYKLIHVQHHHAHIGSVLEEKRIERPVIGVSFDGSGYGTDGNMWGGEFFLVEGCKFKRLAHFKYHMMPGAERVIYEPWRMVLSILGKQGIQFINGVDKREKELILSMMSKNVNSPLTSSAGRIFDAAAALLGVCTKASYEAEGPVKLEAMCVDDTEQRYEFKVSRDKKCYIIDIDGMFLEMAKDLKKGRSKHFMAVKFHNAMVEVIVSIVKKLTRSLGIRDVVFSGGVFQNKFLKTKVSDKLSGCKLKMFVNELNPVNDYNISWGQYYVSRCACKS